MMTAVQGYYDGTNIRLLEDIKVKQNQKVIVTVMDEFVEAEKSITKKSVRGILSKHANKELVKQEKGAWERAMVEKHGTV